MSNIANTSNRANVKKVVGESINNSNELGFAEKFDLILSDGTTTIQKIYLPEENSLSDGGTVDVFVQNATKNTVVYKNDETTVVSTLSATGLATYMSIKGVWTKV